MGKECCFRLSRSGRDEKRAPLKTPAWETKQYRALSLQPPRVFRISNERLFPTILEPGLAEASRYPPGGRYLPRFSFGCLPARKLASGFLLAAKCKLMQIDANRCKLHSRWSAWFLWSDGDGRCGVVCPFFNRFSSLSRQRSR